MSLKLETFHPVPIRCRCVFTLLPSQVLAVLRMVNYLRLYHSTRQGGSERVVEEGGREANISAPGGWACTHTQDLLGINSERNINKSPGLAIGVGVSVHPPPPPSPQQGNSALSMGGGKWRRAALKCKFTQIIKHKRAAPASPLFRSQNV